MQLFKLLLAPSTREYTAPSSWARQSRNSRLVADWYYAKDGERFGPFEAQQIKQLAAQGTLRPTDSVARKGMPNWVQANTVKGLFPAEQQPGQMQAETTLYKDENVQVTNERVLLPDMAIDVSDIISVKVERKRGLLIVWAICCAVPAVIWVCMTIFFLVLSLVRWDFDFILLPGLVMTALWSFGAYALFRADKRDRLWQLVIQLANEKLETLGSMDRSTVVPVADAVNAAIKRRAAS